MSKRLTDGVSWAAMTLALFAAGQAVAQEAEVSELVVTAQRVEENIQQVPIAVTAFGAAALERQSIETLLPLGFRLERWAGPG